MTIDITVVISASTLGAAFGLTLSELRHKKRQITAFNGEKQEMQNKIDSLTDEAIRRTTEQQDFRKRLVKIESFLKLHHYSE